MSRHAKLTTSQGIHTPISYVYANAAERTTASGFDSADIGKLAHQQDDDTFWFLATTTPTWKSTAAGAVTLGTATPTSIEAGAGGQVGTSAFASHEDHVHDIHTAAATTIGSSNTEGTSSSLARADHGHDHGSLSGGSMHAVATQSVAGFLSAADKLALDSLVQGNTTIPVRNTTGVTLLRGRAVTTVGWDNVNHTKLVDYADKDDPALRPAIGVLELDLPDGESGTATVQGQLNGFDTTAWSLTDQLVLGNNGNLSRPPPDVSPFTGEIQNLASVVRVDAVDGRILVSIDGLSPVSADEVFALAGTAGTPGPANKYVTNSDTRNTDDRTASGIRTATGVVAVSGATAPTTGQVLQATGATAAAWSDPLSLTSSAPADVTRATAAAGTATSAARADHKHDVSVGLPVDVGAANAGGSGTALARADHVHKHGSHSNGTDHAAAIASGASGFLTGSDKAKLDGIAMGATNTPLSSSAPANVTKATAAVGVATDAARADHKHDISTASPVAVGSSNAEGTATSLARSDHVHTHGDLAGGSLHAVAVAGTSAGFMSASDKTKLDGVESGAQAVNWAHVAAALGGQAGAHSRYFFVSDGAGSGSMVPHAPKITHRLTVGLSGDDVDYTSIATAVAAAIAGGASASDVWSIVVEPGTYVEPPFTIADGISVVGDNAASVQASFIVASNASADLVTMTGGSLRGFTVMGVTDPAKTCIRCATANSICALELITVMACSNGVVVSNGAHLVINIFTVIIGAPGLDIGTWLLSTGADTLVEIIGCYCFVPAAILPAYAGNPIQVALRAASGAEIVVANGTFAMPDNDGTSSVVLADGGAQVTLLSSSIRDSNWALHIGSSGSNTVINAQVNHTNNVLNVKVDSSTGTVYSDFNVDARAISMVSGGKQIGIVRYRSENLIRLLGSLYYNFAATNTDADLGDFIHDGSSTGVCDGGAVTAGSGLHVVVAAGEGWVRREALEDTFTVLWGAVSSLLLTASTTNYVYYDAVAEAIVASTSAPSETGILLATVVTSGSGIRFLHQTRTLRSNVEGILQAYLLDTRQQISKSGLATVQGSTVRKLSIGSGSYYLGLDTISYAGSGGDATWSYFYGTNGATEVATQTLLDITNYDNAGTLTAMTASYYRCDYLVLTSDGRLSLLYGTSQYATLPLAEAGPTANIPTFLLPSNMPLARVYVQQGVGIASIADARPTRSIGGGTGGGVSVHSALAGLSADDHTQYLLVSGSRSMTGDLNMGAHNITNVGTVSGVSVAAHAARHNPGGADALATGTPVAVSVGASPGAGVASSYALSDHQHGIASGTPVDVGSSNSAGSASSVARSDHVHNHGAQAGGSTHANAIAAGASGFMTGADKTKLDGIAANAAALTASAPANVTKATAAVGTATDAARADHKHDVTTAAATTLSVGGSNAEGTATSLARSDHTHAIPAFGSTAGTFCQGNDSRLTDDRTASGIRTATTVVATSAATAPTAGQALIASSSTVAAWGTEAAGTAGQIQYRSATGFAASANLFWDTTTGSLQLGPSPLSVPTSPLNIADDHNSYSQLYFQNKNAGNAASTDVVVTADNGNDTSYYLDFGINGSTYADPAYSVTGANDGYLIMVGNNLVMGTAGASKVIQLFTGGTLAANLRATVDDTGINLPTGLSYRVNNVALPLLTSSAPANVTKAAAAVGTATTAARADHKHDVTTAAASTLSVGGSNAEGTATSLARSDHTHALPAFGSSAGTFCQGNDSRLGDDRTASGLRTATTVVTVASATAPTAGQVLTASSSTAAAWATPLAVTNSAPANVTKAAAAVGTATDAARSDHKHDVTTAAAVAVTVGGSNGEGTATSLARSDHTHSMVAYGSTAGTICQGNDSRLTDDRTASGLRTATTVVAISSATAPTSGQALVATSSTAATWQTVAALTSSAPADVDKNAAAAGSATTAARADHKHNAATAAPASGAVAIGNSAAEGTATTLARSDHTHTVTGGTPVAVGTANAAGTATTFSRSDHVHQTTDEHGFETFSIALADNVGIDVYTNTSTYGGLIIPGYAHTINSMMVYVYQSAASGTVTGGLYNASTNAQIATTGTASVTTTGIKTMTFSSGQTLTAGTPYYIVIATTGNGSRFIGKTVVGTFNLSPKPAVSQTSSLPATLNPAATASLVWIKAY